MEAQVLLATLFKTANDHLEAVMSDVTEEVANWLPQGIVSSIGAQYVHIITSEDAIVNLLLKGDAPLMASSYAGRIGTEQPPEFFTWGEWGRTSPIDLEQAKTYAQAVYASVQEYVSAQTPDTLAELVDLSAIGFGAMPRHVVLELALRQAYLHGGEISAVKGLQGLKGYPN